MATRKSPARGTGRRPAKAAASSDKVKPAAGKPVTVSAKAATGKIETAQKADTPTTVEPVATAAPAGLTAAEATPVEPAAGWRPTLVGSDEPADKVEPAEAAVESKKLAPSDNVVGLESTPIAEAAPVTDEPAPKPEAAPKSNGAVSEPLFPGFPELPTLGAVDFDAFVASGSVLAEGMRTLGDELVAFSRHTVERNVEATMAVLAASSVEEVVALQSRHAMSSLDEMLNESAKLTGMAIDVANRIALPFIRS